MKKKRFVIYGGSFNPPGLHHLAIKKELEKIFDDGVIAVCGDRPNKPSLNVISRNDRKEIFKLAFSGKNKFGIDTHDLDENTFTRNYALEHIYQNLYPDNEIWHFIGGDILEGGRFGKSQIQTDWWFGEHLWKNINFAILERPGYDVRLNDLPPHYMLIEIKNLNGSSSLIRERVKRGESIKELVTPKVLRYIEEKKLYLV